MNRLFSKIKKEELNAAEKDAIFSSLKAFVKEHPTQSIPSPFYASWFALHRTMLAPALLVFIFVFSGGTVLAAKSSLPGSLLYPVKIFNEKIQSLTTFSSEEKAQLEATQTILRLDEAQELMTAGPLDVKLKEEIEANIEIQAQDAIGQINELKKSGRTKEASKIEQYLDESLEEWEGKAGAGDAAISTFSAPTLKSRKSENNNENTLFDVISNIRAKLEVSSKKDKEDNESNELKIESGETMEAQIATSTPEQSDDEENKEESEDKNKEDYLLNVFESR